MKQVLIITNSKDLTTDYIIDKYSDRVDFFRLNTDRFSDYDITITKEGAFIEYKDQTSGIYTNLCHALYFRKITLPPLDEYDKKYWNLMQREIITVIDGLAEITGNIALTRPSILRRADNKIVQLKLAKELGFNIPDLLISNSNQHASKFCSMNKRSIVKPLSVGRIIEDHKVTYIQTNEVNNNREILGLELSPSYFQSYQEKDFEVRLTIVNGNFFGVKIVSTNKIDWRKQDAKISYSQIDVPEDVANKCIKMMNKLNINFAAFDFIVKDGRYYFLELNANGQWLWLEEKLNLGISAAIVNYLIGEDFNVK